MNTKFKSWLEQQTYAPIADYDAIKKRWVRSWMLHSVKKKTHLNITPHQILKFKWGEVVVVNKNSLSG
jgi:hypothetical protein